MMLYIFFQVPITEVPRVQGDDVNAILGWIIGVLIAALVGVVFHYEKKLNKVSDRLDEVIDESMLRMERSEGLKDNFTEKIHNIVNKLHEILVISRGR